MPNLRIVLDSGDSALDLAPALRDELIIEWVLSRRPFKVPTVPSKSGPRPRQICPASAVASIVGVQLPPPNSRISHLTLGYPPGSLSPLVRDCANTRSHCVTERIRKGHSNSKANCTAAGGAPPAAPPPPLGIAGVARTTPPPPGGGVTTAVS